MKTGLYFYICALAMWLALCQVSAQTGHSPKPGSAERKAIMDALRPYAQKDAKRLNKNYKAGIKFYQVEIRAKSGWAWVSAITMDTAGKQLPLGDAATQGLLQKVKDKWHVKYYGVSSDVACLEEAIKRFPRAPKWIFNYNPPRGRK